MNKTLFLAILCALLLATAQARCTVCGRCIGCTPEVFADSYINDIDGLLQSKIEMLGYLVHIDRAESQTEIKYELVYSGGLLIKLALQLPSLQIQLISYEITGDDNTHTQFVTSTSTTSTTKSQVPSSPAPTEPVTAPPPVQTAPDGFLIISDFSDVRVTSAMSFLESTIQERLTNFKLSGFELSPDGNTYRLTFKVLPACTQLITVEQTVTLSRIPSGFRLIDSTYEDIPSRPFVQFDVRSLVNDPWASRINDMLLRRYATQLAQTNLAEFYKAEPYFRFVYEVGNIKWSFVVLYDYFQRRIVEGNVTQTEVTKTSSGSSLTTQTTSTSSSQSTSTSTSSSSSSSAGSSSSNRLSTQWQTIREYQQDQQARGAVSFLTAFGQLAQLRRVLSMQRRNNGTHTLYDITAELNSLGGVELGDKMVFFRYDISYESSSGRYVLEDAAYISLPSPNFQRLSIEEIRSDRNIVEIAKFLLNQGSDDRLEASSRVVSVSRDLPYYRLTFLARNNIQLSYVILLNINGAVQVVDVVQEQTTQQQQQSSISATSATSQGSSTSGQSQATTTTTVPQTTTTTTTTTVRQTSMPSVSTISSSSSRQGSSSQSSSTSSSSSFSTTASSSQSSSSQSSSSASSTSPPTVRYAGASYARVPDSVQSQQIIQIYLQFLSGSGLGYSVQNLMGIYTNPLVANSLLFQFRQIGGGIASLLTTTVEVQRLVATYIRDQEQSSSSTTTSSVLSGSSSSEQSNEASNGTTLTQIFRSDEPDQSTQQTTQTTTSTQTSQPVQTIQTTQQTVSSSQTGQSTQQVSTVTSGSLPRQPTQTVTVTTAPNHRLVNADPNCLCYEEEKCLRCAHRYFLKDNRCHLIPDSCLSFDVGTGQCLGCVPGYELDRQGNCKLEVITAYYFQNQCLSCYANQRLINGKCVAVVQSDPLMPNYKHFKNPLCLSWQGNSCLECYPGAYKSKRGLCEMLDPFCAVFEYVSETCERCEDGYRLANGKCHLM